MDSKKLTRSNSCPAMDSKDNETREGGYYASININETIVEASKAGIRALLELSNTPVAFVDVSKVDIAPRYLSTNEAAKYNKIALAALTTAVRSKAIVPETVEVDDGSAWLSQPFGKYRIYNLVMKEERTDTGEVERLREELQTEKQMVEKYRKAYEDMKFESSDTARQCRTMVNGTIGLSEMLMEKLQAKSSALTKEEIRSMTDMASTVKSVGFNAIEVLEGVHERQDKIHRIVEPFLPTPPVPRLEPSVLKSWHKAPPAPAKNELIYEYCSNIRVLIVEDNIVNQKILRRIMMKGKVKDENIVVAETSDEALDILTRDPHFDLVWVDQTMTPMLGVELVEHIMMPERRMNYPPWFTLVGMLVCYFKDDPYEKRMREAGATDVVLKPVRLAWVLGHCLRVAEMKRNANLPMLPWKL